MNDEFIRVAASDSEEWAKEAADLVCEGKNDERVLQAAVDRCIEERKNVYLYNGIYRIDGFYDFGDGGPVTAIRLPNAHREIIFKGQNNEYGFQKRYDNGVVLYVTPSALESIEDTADVIRGTWTFKGIQNGASHNLENLAVVLANNAHPIRCIDLRRTDRAEVKNVTMVGYGDEIKPDSKVGLHENPALAHEGCIGLTMTDGSNYNYSNYTNVFTYGFGEGIQVGGEHVVCINCGATLGVYGFTFGNYEVNCGANHPITLINCLDERNVNLPLFGKFCGDQDGKGGRLIGRQEITMINLNVERIADKTPGGVVKDRMREVVPGSWSGSIEFTAQPGWCAINSIDFKLWENDGSGSGIKTRNSCHKQMCSTEERLSYYPTLNQQLFDTDLGKMLVCIDPENKVWVDFLGNPV